MKRSWFTITGGRFAKWATSFGVTFVSILAFLLIFYNADIESFDVHCTTDVEHPYYQNLFSNLTHGDICSVPIHVKVPGVTVDVYNNDKLELQVFPEVTWSQLYIKDGRCKSIYTTPHKGFCPIDFSEKRRSDTKYVFRFQADKEYVFLADFKKEDIDAAVKWTLFATDGELDPILYSPYVNNATVYDNHIYFNFSDNTTDVGEMDVIAVTNTTGNWSPIVGDSILVSYTNESYKINISKFPSSPQYAGFAFNTTQERVSANSRTDFAFKMNDGRVVYIDNKLFCEQSLVPCFVTDYQGLPTIIGLFNDSYDPTITLINGTDFNGTFNINMSNSRDFSFLNVNDSSIVGFWNFNADGQEKRPAGQVQTSLDIDSGGSEIVTFNDIKQIHNLTGFSLFMWVNPDTVTGEKIIVGQWEIGGETIFFFESFGNEIGAVIATSDTDGVIGTFARTDSADLVIGQWSHVGFVFNGSGTGNAERLKMYVDGVEESITFSGGTMPSSLSDGDINVTLGRLVSGGGTFYDAQYDELVMYNRSLSTTEITTIFDRGVEGLDNQVTDGRISYYKFDEFTGLSVLDSGTAGENGLANYLPITAYDFSGNGNDGTYFNDANNNITFKGPAVIMDGAADKIVIQNSDSLNDFTNQMTISMWVNPGSNQTAAGLGSRLIAKGANTWQITYSAPNPINGAFAGKVSAKINGSFAAVTSNVILPREVFTHVVLTYNGTDKELFFNNVSVGINSETADVGRDSNVVTIGSSTATKNFNGSLDDVLLSNRGFNRSEVSALFKNQSPNYFPSGTQTFLAVDFNASACNGGCDQIVLNNSLIVDEPTTTDVQLQVDFWRGNDTDGYNTFKNIFNGLLGHWTGDGSPDDLLGLNDGTFVGDANASVDGIYSTAFGLDGAGDYIDAGDIPTIANLTKFTVFAWIKPESVTGPHAIVTKWAHNLQDTFGFEMDGDELRVFIAERLTDGGSNSTMTTNTNLVVGEYTFVGFVFNGDGATNADKMKIYVDGVEADVSFVGTIGTVLTDATSSLTIGSFTGALQRRFDGSIDDVMIWNRSLSSTEVSDLFTQRTANSLLGYWTGDGSAADELGLNDGTFVGDANASQVGIYDNAFGLDGTGDSVSIGDIEEIKNLTEFSAFVWMDARDLPLQSVFLTKWFHPTVTTFAFQTLNDEVRVFISDDITDTGSNHGTTTNANLLENTSTHIGFIFNGSGSTNADRLKIYVNGVEETVTYVGTIPSQLTDGNASLTIGAFTGSITLPFVGDLDDVMTWRRALSPDDVKDVYTSGLADWQTGDTSQGNAGNVYNVSSITEKVLPIIKMISDVLNSNTPLFKSTSIGTLDKSLAVGDSCVYTSGTFNIDCSESCTVSGTTDVLGNDIVVTGSGTITVEGDITNYATLTVEGTDSINQCTMLLTTGSIS